jgi:hypothetical protein
MAVVTHTVAIFLFRVVNHVMCLVMADMNWLGHNNRSRGAAAKQVSGCRNCGPFHYGSEGNHQ